MIEKAPIINENLARGGDWTDSQVEVLIELQRDADDQYYTEGEGRKQIHQEEVQQFVKLLREGITLELGGIQVWISAQILYASRQVRNEQFEGRKKNG